MKPLSFLSMLFFSIILTNCASSKLEAPFTIKKITKEKEGLRTTIYASITNSNKVDFKQFFYNEMIIDVKEEYKNGITILTGVFNEQNKFKNLNLHKNSSEEFSNKTSTKKFPFKYKKDEVFVSYKKNNTIYYYKLSNNEAADN